MKEPRQGKISSALDSWCHSAAPGETRTVLIRPGFSADLDAAVSDLDRLGVQVQSAGPGAISAVVRPEDLPPLADLRWVKAVEEPRVRLPLRPKW